MPSGYPNDPKNALQRGTVSKYDPEFHPSDLIQRMGEGQIDVEIYADWDISRKTFCLWKRDYPELEEAYNKGLAKWRKCWFSKGREYMEKGNREAYKYWAHILGIKGEQEDRLERQALGTTINVQQMNQINYDSKSEVELKQILQNKLDKLNLQNPLDSTIDAEYKVLKNDSESE